MFSVIKINLRRIVSLFLVSITLFLGIGIISNSPSAIADSITRDVTNAPPEAPMSDRAYEAMKAGRQQKQAMRSEKAEAQAERISDNQTIGEKLNLDEDLPESTQKFIDQFTDD